MPLRARDIMQTKIHSVGPRMQLTTLEREFLAKKVNGFPVVENNRLVGIVSRSDVVRQLCVEETYADLVADYYGDLANEPSPALAPEASKRVGKRFDQLRVQDLMIRKLIVAKPDDPIETVASLMVQHRVHRILITDNDRLVGIISTLDYTRLVAEGKVTAK